MDGVKPRRYSIPRYVTHYYPAQDKPFQNLSEACEADLPRIIEALGEHRRTDSTYKRVFGRAYMAFRRDTEARLRELFLAAGGKSERRSPHYFVLGTSPWFAGLYPETKSVTLSLDELSPLTASFTYPDSGVAMGFGPKYGLPPEPVQPYHNHVYLINDLAKVIALYGLPDGADNDSDYADYHRKKFEKYIEVQLWTDGPVRRFMCDMS